MVLTKKLQIIIETIGGPAATGEFVLGPFPIGAAG